MTGMLFAMSALSTKLGALLQSSMTQGRQLLFPNGCLFCRASLPDKDGCCADCLQQIRIWPHATCQRCGRLLPESITPGPCGDCLKHPPSQQQTHHLYQYHGPVRDAILQWKLAGKGAAARWLITAAEPRLTGIIQPHDLLLPMPAPLSRMRKSGQHHAAVLCRWLSEATGARVEWRLLRRIGQQPRQSSLSGMARRKNLRKAFGLSDDYRSQLGAIAPDTRLWVVDDIFTTGSSVHYAARAVIKTGIPVNVLTLARTQ